MNWKLIFGLSLWGLAMAFTTVSWDQPKLEQFTWLLIFLLCAGLIAKFATDKFFLHGFLVNLVNCIWIIVVHIMLADKYFAHHPIETTQSIKMNRELGVSTIQFILLTEPLKGIFSAIILGLFAQIAAGIQSAINDK